MNIELEKYLKGAKIPAHIIAAIKKDEVPADFNAEEAIDKRKADEKAWWDAEIRPEVEKTLKASMSSEIAAAKKAAEESGKSFLKSTFGLDIPVKELKEMSYKDVIKMSKEAASSSSGKSEEEYKKKNVELQNMLLEAQEELTNTKTALEEQKGLIPEIEKKAELKFKTKANILSVFDKFIWADEGERLARIKRNLERDIEEFQITNPETLEFTKEDGVKLQKPDQSGVFNNVEEWLAFQGKRYGYFKKQEGLPGAGGGAAGADSVVIKRKGADGKEITVNYDAQVADLAKSKGIPIEQARTIFEKVLSNQKQ